MKTMQMAPLEMVAQWRLSVTTALVVLTLCSLASSKPHRVRRAGVNDFLTPLVYTSPNRKAVERMDDQLKAVGKDRKVEVGVKYINDFSDDVPRQEDKLESSFSKEKKTHYKNINEYLKKNKKELKSADEPKGEDYKVEGGKVFLPIRMISDRLPMDVDIDGDAEHESDDKDRYLSERLPMKDSDVHEKHKTDDDNKKYPPMRYISDRLPMDADSFDEERHKIDEGNRELLPVRGMYDRLPMNKENHVKEELGKDDVNKKFPPIRIISDRLPMSVDVDAEQDNQKEGTENGKNSDRQSVAAVDSNAQHKEDVGKTKYPPMRDISDRLPMPFESEGDGNLRKNNEDGKVYLPMRDISDRLPELEGIILPLDSEPKSDDSSEEEDAGGIRKAETDGVETRVETPVVRDTVTPVEESDVDQETVMVPRMPESNDQEPRYSPDPAPEGEPRDDSREEPDLEQGPQIYPRFVIPRGFGYSVPILVPVRRLTFGPISIIPVPVDDVSGRLPMIGEEVVADATEEKEPGQDGKGDVQRGKQMDLTESQRKAAFDAGSQFGVGMRFPFWSLQQMLLREVEDAILKLNNATVEEDKEDPEIQNGGSKTANVDGNRIHMQTRVMRIPNGDGSRMFVRVVSVVPMRAEGQPSGGKDQSEKNLDGTLLKKEQDKPIATENIALKTEQDDSSPTENAFKTVEEELLKQVVGEILEEADSDRSHEAHLRSKQRDDLEKRRNQVEKNGGKQETVKDLDAAEAKDFELLEGYSNQRQT